MRCTPRFLAAFVAMACIGLTHTQAALLTEISFNDGLAPGTTLADSTSAAGSTGVTANFDAITNGANTSRVAGISRNPSENGNAFQLNGSSRFRSIIDRTTPAWQGSGLLEALGNPNTAIGGPSVDGTLYGSLLIQNTTGMASGFSGLEFAFGNPNANRVITIGEAPSNTPGTQDFVVLGPGQAGGASDLALPAINGDEVREILFQIDYVSGGQDTFSLINTDGSVISSGSGSFQFSTLHLASFGGAPPINYDQIRLGTTLESVLPTPEPSSLVSLGVLLSGMAIRRRR